MEYDKYIVGYYQATTWLFSMNMGIAYPWPSIGLWGVNWPKWPEMGSMYRSVVQYTGTLQIYIYIYVNRLCSYSPVILWYHVILPWYHVILTSIPCDTTSFDSLGIWHGPWYQAPSSFTCLQDIILPLRNMQAAKTAGNGDPCYVRPKIPAVSFTAVKQLKKWTSVSCFPLWVDSIGGFHKWRYPNSWMVYSDYRGKSY